MRPSRPALLILSLASASFSKELPDFQSFVTEPHFTAVTIDILENKHPEAQAPGYIFIAPYHGHTGWGPQIIEANGELVWWGGHTVNRRGIDLQPCLFNSSIYDHLCYNDAQPAEQGGHSVGEVRVFDNTYNQVGEDYGATNGLRGPDIHEMNTPTPQRGRTFIQDIYQIRPMDLTQWGGPEEGFVLDGCFQEIEFLTREIVFQWCSVDHIPFETTFVYLPDSGNYSIPGLAGNGHQDRPWDWFHINAIDRNEAGDYVISSRHCHSIFHIAGPDNKNVTPGDLIWALGGKLNNFEMGSLNFTAQHTVRYHRQDNSSHMSISLLNNAFEGHTKTSTKSSGLLINLNLDTMHASLGARFWQPSGYLAQDQGGVRILPNGNAFIGWGRCNYFSEHAPSGEVLLYTQFGGKGDCDDDPDKFFVSSFRAWKAPWKGNPQTPPKVVAYAKTCDSPLHVYVSWNGATEVAYWDMYATNYTRPAGSPDALEHVGRYAKSGFETTVKLNFAQALLVRPLDKDGKEIGLIESVTQTFVPKPELSCGDEMCDNVLDIYKKSNSVVDQCRVSSDGDSNSGSTSDGNSNSGSTSDGDSNSGSTSYHGAGENLPTLEDGTSSLTFNAGSHSTDITAGWLPFLYLMQNGFNKIRVLMHSG